MYQYLAEHNRIALADRTHVQPLALLISQSNQTAVLWQIVLPIGVPGVSAGKFTMGLLSPRDDIQRQSMEILA